MQPLEIVLSTYTRAELESWPHWLQEKWYRYLRMVQKLQLQAAGSVMYISILAAACLVAFTAPGGVAYYYGRPFPLAGPGAHPQDIREAIMNFGQREKNSNGALRSKYKNIVCRTVKEYLDFLDNDSSEFPTELLLTSGPARVRGKILRVAPLRVDTVLPTCDWRIPLRFTSSTIAELNDGPGFASVVKLQYHELCSILMRQSWPDNQTWKSIIDQGGSWNEERLRWVDLAKHVCSILLNDDRMKQDFED